MRKSLDAVLSFAAFVIMPLANAQEETSKLEAYGGYNYVRFNISAKVADFPPRRRSMETAEAVNSSTTRTAGLALWEISPATTCQLQADTKKRLPTSSGPE